MKTISLNEVLRKIYDERTEFVRSKNVELERKYFTKNSERIPMGEIMIGSSYEDHFVRFKEIAKNGNANELEKMFKLIRDYFLFSNGHDMMFKKKLEADLFTSVPIDELIYPMLSEAVNDRYNDVSVMKENPNRDTNIECIDRLVSDYIDVQSILYLIYCNDFIFPDYWKLHPDAHEKVLNILNNSGMTIGDFLRALTNFKCNKMEEIFGMVEDPELRNHYLSEVESLKKEKHEYTKSFYIAPLSITYFLDHTIFMNFERKSSILDVEDTSFPKEKKILLPRK